MRFVYGLALGFLFACAPLTTTISNSKPSEKEYQRAIPTMGTVFKISLWAADPQRIETIFADIGKILDQANQSASTYISTSEVSRINANAGRDEFIPISEPLARLITFSLEQAELSHGMFDPTIGPLVRLWGFFLPHHGGENTLPPQKAIKEARELVDYKYVKITSDGRKARLLLPGMQLDFGAIAKGFALDEIQAFLKSVGIRRAMMSLGDQLMFLGTPSEESDVWEVGIRDPRQPAHVMTTIKVKEGSVSTSGNYSRFFKHGQKKYAHILDPHTGWPVQGMASVTVWAPSAAMADAWSTALFVSGIERGKELLSQHTTPMIAVWIKDPVDGIIMFP